MVQIIENHAEIRGTLVSREEDPERPGFVRLLVKVEQAAPVAHWPNLFEPHVGESVVLHVRSEEAPQCGPAEAIHVRARMAGPNLAFVET